MTNTATVEGKQVTIGDWVGFKCDIEQYGRIIEIRGAVLILSSEGEGFSGDYIGGQLTAEVDIDDCWI